MYFTIRELAAFKSYLCRPEELFKHTQESKIDMIGIYKYRQNIVYSRSLEIILLELITIRV
jgi:hypothetical protein